MTLVITTAGHVGCCGLDGQVCQSDCLVHAWTSEHVDGKPMVQWKVWTFGIGACAWRFLMHLDAVNTHTRHAAFPLHSCIEVMGGALGL